MENNYCEGCLCKECNENYENCGECMSCEDCNRTPKSVCLEGKFRNDYGD